MALVERPPRTITCADCGATEQRSPYGPAPKTCLPCQEKRNDASDIKTGHRRAPAYRKPRMVARP